MDNALEQATAIHVLALTLASSLTAEETSRLGLLLIQLGTTLDTISALRSLDGEAGGAASEIGER